MVEKNILTNFNRENYIYNEICNTCVQIVQNIYLVFSYVQIGTLPLTVFIKY